MDQKKYDVVALGELLIDFTQNGKSEQGNPVFEANPGGAPCNVLSMLAKLGHKTAFIGKVGDDGFGHQLEQALMEVGIDTVNLKFDKEVHTTLAIVQTFENGDRDFSFYRKPGADMMITKGEVSGELLKETKAFHFGTLSMTDDENTEATKYALALARENGALITFDPNIRMPLWDSEEHLREAMSYGMEYCQVLKISDNEIQWFTGEEDFDKGVERIRAKYDIPLILVSMGPEGSRAYYKDMIVSQAPFLQENTIETTGAGDTFMACVIHKVLTCGLDQLDRCKLQEMLIFANAAASLITTKKGALRVMPTKDEVLALIQARTQ
ncbi:MAG: carbohydrate kinase [Lachnospiraceae bacterium]|nr:carbohydrate kinase [Lachnospiraceae bacterium]